MEISNIAIEKIKAFEGCRLKAYKCPAGVWTIGYGHTRGVKAGQVITQEQAESLLRGDILPAKKYVDGLRLTLTQGQFDALVDFVFNLGSARLGASTLLKYVRAKKPADEIQAQFNKWVYAGGKKLDGLVKRRAWEAKRWVE